MVPGLLAACTASLLIPLAHGQVVHVDADLGTGANDGTSWADAYQGADGLRTALGAAAPGSEVWVTEGIYRGLPSAAAGFQVTANDLTLRGGFLGGEASIFERPEPGTAPTILSGDAAGDDNGTAANMADNCVIVLEADDAGTLTMERLAITSAFDNGFVARGSNAQVRDCAFMDCAGLGAFVSTLGSPPTLRSAGNLVDCTFAGNGFGGLFYFGSPSQAQPIGVDRCLFEFNGGAGMRVGNTIAPRLIIANSIARSNGGPGLQITSQSDGANVEVNRWTLVDNGGSGLSYVGVCGFCFQPDAFDCIVWENVGPEVDFGAQGIVNGGFVQGPGSVATDEMFVDFAAGDLRLAPGSPAIDAGTGPPRSQAPFALDFARGPRVHDDPAAPTGGPASTSADAGALERSPFIGRVEVTCEAVPNSSGARGQVLATGSPGAAVNDLTLVASALPPTQFGIFLASRSAGNTPMAGGEGTLCLGGSTGRFNGQGQVLSSGPLGTFSLAIDLTRVPQPSAFAQVQVGETWRFQAWHRDLVSGGQSTNFTSSVALTFE